jgi:glycosylphosphatidylinositol transamidase (GPIT) subunit GPI8
LASSSFDEKSLSKGYDKVLNGPKSDEFTFYLSEYLEGRNPLKMNTTIQQLYEYMDFKKLKVHAKIVARNKKYRSKYLGEFMARRARVQEARP